MRDLQRRVPAEVRARVAAVVEALERHGPPVARALRELGAVTGEVDAWLGVPPDLSTGELAEPTDAERLAVTARLGVDRAWELADLLVGAHPDLPAS